MFFRVRPVAAGLVIGGYYLAQPKATSLSLRQPKVLDSTEPRLLRRHSREMCHQAGLWSLDPHCSTVTGGGGGMEQSVAAVKLLWNSTGRPPHPRSVGHSLVPSAPASPFLILFFSSLLHQAVFCSPAAVLITRFSTAAPTLFSGNERIF